MSNYEVIACNYSESSENLIHSDEIAQKYGFKGALVPGVAVYGHLSYPLVHAAGAGWLGHSQGNLRLLKPAYHGDRLLLALQEVADGQQVTCHNSAGELLATLVSSQPQTLPKGEYVHLFDAPFKTPERVLMEWDSIVPEQPFVPWAFDITAEENQRYTSEVNDPLALYGEYAHPHLLCSLANTALTNEYFMPTWLHVGTESRHHLPLRVGDSISIRCVPSKKWRNKGHEFIQLYVSFWRGDELTTDMLHTAIYKVAG